jgi:hypothetical protein
MSRELIVGVEATSEWITVETRYRLQHRGSDFWLYANSDFGPLQDSDSELLRRIVDLFRMNNSGIEKVQVFPFRLMMSNTPVITPEYVQDLVRTAALRAGFKPTFTDIMFKSYTRNGGVTRTKLNRSMGKAASNGVALLGGEHGKKNTSFEGEYQYSSGGERLN